MLDYIVVIFVYNKQINNSEVSFHCNETEKEFNKTHVVSYTQNSHYSLMKL